MAEINWPYIAGFFDGEGCLYVQFVDGYIQRCCWTVAQTKSRNHVLFEIAEFFDDHCIDSKFHSQRPALGREDSTYLRIHLRDDVEYVLKNLMPWLIVKKEEAVGTLAAIEEVKKLREKHGRHWRVALKNGV